MGLHPGADHFFMWYITLVVNSVVALTLFIGIGAGMICHIDYPIKCSFAIASPNARVATIFAPIGLLLSLCLSPFPDRFSHCDLLAVRRLLRECVIICLIIVIV